MSVNRTVSVELPNNMWHAYSVFITTIVSFYCLGKCFKIIDVTKLDVDPWIFWNHAVSGIHGILAGIWGCLCLYFYPELWNDPESVNNSDFVYRMVIFCAGYFVYDFLDMIINNKVIKCWEVTLHHIVVIFVFWYNWHYRIFIGYSVIALLTEGNSFFLHGRKILRMCKVGSENLFYRICVHLNLSSFVLFRIIPILRTLRGCYDEFDRFPMIPIFVTVGCVVVGVINVILFWRLFKTDIIRPYLKKPKKEAMFVNNNISHQKDD